MQSNKVVVVLAEALVQVCSVQALQCATTIADTLYSRTYLSLTGSVVRASALWPHRRVVSLQLCSRV